MSMLTYKKPNGEWGIEGVDLSTLPPKAYGALCKLKDMEHGELVDREMLAISLRALAEITCGPVCGGCGLEHNCRTEGCAVLLRAARIIERDGKC